MEDAETELLSLPGCTTQDLTITPACFPIADAKKILVLSKVAEFALHCSALLSP
jgi:hypothetical protein